MFFFCPRGWVVARGPEFCLPAAYLFFPSRLLIDFSCEERRPFVFLTLPTAARQRRSRFAVVFLQDRSLFLTSPHRRQPFLPFFLFPFLAGASALIGLSFFPYAPSFSCGSFPSLCFLFLRRSNYSFAPHQLFLPPVLEPQ